MRYFNSIVLQGADVSTNQMSSAVDVSFCFQLSLQAILTGSPMGELTLQASNDKVKDANLAMDTIPMNWSDVVIVPMDGVNNLLISPVISSYQWVRIKWIAGVGSTGSLTVNIKVNAA